MSKTVSKVAGFVIGAVLIGIGIATGNVGLIVQGGAMIVTQAIVDLTAAKVPARQASEQSIQLGETPRVMQIGETFTAGSLVDGFNYGGKYGTDWECLVIRLADHKCEGLTGFYVNDEYNAYTADGLVARYDDQLEIYFRSDTTNQALPARVTDHGPGWTSADVGESGCDVVVCYKADKPDDKHPGWPGGRPRFGFVIKGKLCYDPRLDDTVTGGSGAHRWDDPTTWEWSDNPVICRYNWVRGVYANDDVTDQSALLVGRGLSADEAPPENIFAAANLCDEIAGAVFPFTTTAGWPNYLGSFKFNDDHSRFLVVNPLTGAIQIYDTATRSLVSNTFIPHGIGETESLIRDWLGSVTYGTTIIGGVGHLIQTDGLGRGGVSVSGGLPNTVDGCEVVEGRVFVYSIANKVREVSPGTDGLATDLSISFSPDHYFPDGAGRIWCCGDGAGTTVWLYCLNDTTTYSFTSPIGSSNDMFAAFNSDGNIVCFQEGGLFTINPATGATIASGSSLYTTGSGTVRPPVRNLEPGASSIWITGKEISLTTCAVIRTVTLGNWYSSATVDTIYDRINNALISPDAAGIHWRELDRNGGYRVSGPIYSNQDFIDVEGMFAAATAGNIITHEGSVELEPGQAKSVVATITDDDLLVGGQASWNHGFLSESNAEWVNGVVGRYVEPSLQWQDHATPIARDTADIISDGRPREASITMRLVRYLQQAQRVVEINRRLGRLWGRASVKLGPRFCELEEGDWIIWQSDRYGFTKTFRIEAYSIDEKWQITLTLREISAGVYADDYDFPVDSSQPGTTPPPPDIGPPDDANWALAAVTLDSIGASVPGLEITGSASDDDYVDAIVFEYWKDDGAGDPVADPDSVAWISAGRLSPDTTKVDITSIVGGATYYGAVTYVVSGVLGDRLVLGPVTVSDYSSGFIALEDDTTPLQLEDGLTPYNLG